MKWILNIDKKYKVPYILTNIILIFFDTIGFIIPIFVGFLVDSVVNNNDFTKVLHISIFLIIFTIITVLGSYISVIKLDILCEKITSNLKEKCYVHLNNLDYHFYEHNNKGELMTNFTSDMNRIRRHITFNIKTIGALVLTFIFSLIYLLTINALFTLILLLPALLIGISSLFFVKKIRPEYEKLRDLTAKTNDYISDNVEGNRVVKSFALEQKEIATLESINKNFVKNDIEVGLKETKFYTVVDILSYMMNIIFILGGGILFIDNKISLGDLIIFNSYLYNLRAPFLRLSNLLNSIQRYLIAKKRVKELLDAKPVIILDGKKKIDSLQVPIEFKNVSIIYDKKIVVQNLNLKINPNETVAFIGKTGSGKSSIVNLLLGFITPRTGEILINGENYLNYDIKDIRSKIGYVSQNAFLFSDTIHNNIGYGRDFLSENDAQKYADIARCTYIAKMPQGLDTVIGEKGVGLSGGEKQRLSLARALAIEPDILLLDDITSALDIETEEKINESINNLDIKKTKIIIASKIVSVKNADKIFVLDNGRIIESGTHEELLAQRGYYYELDNIGKGVI